MKKLLYILLLVIVTTSSHAQEIPNSLVTLSTLADLRAKVPQQKQIIQILGLANSTDKNGGFYNWNANSTATDDGFTIIASNGISTGRWERMLNANTLKQDVTLSGTVLQTAYPITFTTALPVPPAMIIPSAYSLTASEKCWISNVTATGCTLNFNSVPILGTNNIVMKLLIIKQ